MTAPTDTPTDSPSGTRGRDADVLAAGPRLRERARDERRARQRRLHVWGAAIAAVLAPLLAAAWLVFASPAFDVDQVRVSGSARLSEVQVAEATGVVPGDALATVDLGDVRRRVAALPGIASVTVQRQWPGTLVVRVTERVPVAMVERPDKSVLLVDATGVVVGAASGAASQPGLTLLLVPAPGPRPGDPTTVAALTVLAELPPALRAETTSVSGESPRRVVLGVRGRTVVWGSPGDADSKAAAVLALLGRPGGQIDVSSPELAVVRKPER